VTIIYDRSFNLNEIFIIVQLLLGFTLVWKFRKRFTIKELLVYFLYNIYMGILIDHSISIPPCDFYDVNDSSAYEFMDFLTYCSFGAYGYFFIYFYDYFKIKISFTPVYIIIWATISVSVEFIAQKFGVFHYKNGYQIFYSFPIYLLVLLPNILIYKSFKSKKL